MAVKTKTNELPEAKLIKGKLIRHFGKNVEDATTEQIYQAVAMCVRDELMEEWMISVEESKKRRLKTIIYMSAEFLMGRALVNNLINLDRLDAYKEALESMNIDLGEIEDEEADAALGNGGLGRLAACFLESLATLDLPAYGCGIRYEHGLFAQRILDGAQVEIEDNWLETGEVWEIERVEDEVEVKFGGEVNEVWDENGLTIEHVNYSSVIGVPYDMPVIGYKSNAPATLRLWSARGKKNLDMSFFNRGDYARAMEERELAEVISKVLYPEDNHEAGKQLRLKQYYFFTSATMQWMVQTHKRNFGNIYDLPKYYEIQINDTHPTLAMPELMRILMDQEHLSWEDAFDITSKMFNYTNHTILTEALERWPKEMLRMLLPRIYKIIEILNEKYCEKLWEAFPGEFDKISHHAIVAYNEVRMANLCVYVCKKVNGVSQLHGEILKTSLFRDQYVMEPKKFIAITNGITHRRWLVKANPALTNVLKETIGDKFIKDYREFEKLAEFIKDPAFLEKIAVAKQHNKRRLAEYVFKKQGIVLHEDAVFDVQAKRLHEYKRQLLKVMHILYLYNRACEDRTSIKEKITFIFAAKASPGYTRAKNIIRLINAVGDLVNNDPRTKDLLQVVFIENYGVSAAEILIPATEISEQISTAGKEASGTGNMKFMMNGAITIGTLDGANVEMVERATRENMYIFGATVEEIGYMNRYGTYKPGEYYEKDKQIRDVLGRLIDNSLPGVSERQFSDIYQSLVFGDYDKPDQYYLLYDFEPYVNAYDKMISAYSDRPKWLKMMASNIAVSGWFSSDRTIGDYNAKIWGLTPFEG